jgi:hypothetical protein
MELSLEGVTMRLAPAPPPEPTAEQQEREPDDPMLNPGLYPNGIVPGYTLEAES